MKNYSKGERKELATNGVAYCKYCRQVTEFKNGICKICKNF